MPLDAKSTGATNTSGFLSAAADICIGQLFATLSAKITLHQLLLRFRFEAVDGARVAFSYIPNVAPKNGLPLRVTRLPAAERSSRRHSASVRL